LPVFVGFFLFVHGLNRVGSVAEREGEGERGKGKGEREKGKGVKGLRG